MVQANKGTISRSRRLGCAALGDLASSHLLARLQDDLAVPKTRKGLVIEHGDTAAILHSMIC